MTDPLHDHDDELVSAVLDGESNDAERAVVAGDPRLQARLEELRGVAAAVATPVAAPTERREAAIAAALAAPVAPVAPVVDLGAARQRRRWGIVAGAAAAALVAIVALAALVGDPGPRTTETAAVQDQADDSTDVPTDADGGHTDEMLADRPPAGAEAEAADGSLDGAFEDVMGDGPSTPSPPATTPTLDDEPAVPAESALLAPTDLGSFATRRDAQVAVSEAIDRALADVEVGPDAPDRQLADGACDQVLRDQDGELAGLVFAGTYDVAGVAHQALVYRLVQTGAQNGTHRVYELAGSRCAVVSTATIA